MSNLEIILSLVSLAATAVGIYVGLKVAPLEKQIEQERKDRADEMGALRASFDERIKALRDDHKEKVKDLERRMNDIEKSALSRAEHAEFRAEVMAAVKEVGHLVNDSINGLSMRMERLVERVAKVEAST